MARDKTIKILRTTRANLNSQKTASGLLAGEPYLITDEGRLAIGTDVNDYADMAKKSEVDAKKTDNVSATSRILGRKTAGSGAIEELTLSEIMDFIGSAAEGDILYRGASAWARLGKGSDGQVLTLASGLPSWAAAAGAVPASFGYALQSNFTATGSSKVDVTNMSFNVEANKKYYVLFSPRMLLGSGETTVSCYVQAPTNSRYSGHYHLLGSTSNTGVWVYTTTVPYVYVQTTGGIFIAHLLIETVNSGTIKLQIEPYPGNTASGLYASSLLIIKEVD